MVRAATLLSEAVLAGPFYPLSSSETNWRCNAMRVPTYAFPPFMRDTSVNVAASWGDTAEPGSKAQIPPPLDPESRRAARVPAVVFHALRNRSIRCVSLEQPFWL
jgi:hypothetical protein